jgi:hypothetical protein
MTLLKIIIHMRESSESSQNYFPEWGSVAYDVAERDGKGICLPFSELRASTIFIIKQHFKSNHKTLLKKTKAEIEQNIAVYCNILRFSVTVFGWQVCSRVLLRMRMHYFKTAMKREGTFSN